MNWLRSHAATWHAGPALSPGRGALQRVPLGQTPSLHHLRHRSLGFVRRLLRYYGPVRLPATVHHRRVSSDFPMRPVDTRATGSRGISRFPRRAFPVVLGISDRAGSNRLSRWRGDGCGLPPDSTASTPRRSRRSRGEAFLSRLNTRPDRTPVNASPQALRPETHDSGPAWLARPSPYDSFIHDTLPVFTGARSPK